MTSQQNVTTKTTKSSNHSPNNNNNNPTNNNNTTVNTRRNNLLHFPPAEQPDIVRAAQKDDFYKRLFNEQCYDLISRIAGARVSMQKQREVRLVSELIYYSLNTLAGPTQTLGEEYCDILMVKPTGKHNFMKPPSGLDRVVLVLWQVLVPYLLTRLSERWLYPVAPHVVLPYLRDFIPKLQRFHLALFYFNGRFYDFSKRMSNIHYIFNGKIEQRRPQYHILGVLILIQFMVTLMMYVRENLLPHYAGFLLNSVSPQIEDLSDQINTTEAEEGNQSAPKCTLCLESRRNTTATLCGHLFCWECITEWCNNKPECPLCRRPLTLQSLVCVYHYQ